MMAAEISSALCQKFNTVEGRRELIRRHHGLWTGTNTDGESVLAAISASGIKLTTNQDNGWVRVNYYDAQGTPSGETFDGKWT